MSKNDNPFAKPFVALLGVIALPFFVLYWPLKALYDLVQALINSPALEERKARKLTHQLYEQATASASQDDYDVPYLLEVFGNNYKDIPDDLFEQMAWIAQAYGRPACAIPEPPAICNSIEGARYRDFLSRQTAPPRSAARVFAQAFNELRFALPCCEADSGLTVSLSTAVPNLNKLVQDVILAFYQEGGEEFVELRKQFDHNLYEASGGGKREVFPEDYKGSDVVGTYLRGTPFADLFSVRVPFDIPERVRFEHAHLVASSGFGKTQTIQFMLCRDLPKVMSGQASVIVIDSQGDLINRISHIKGIEDRLILIDPTDIEFPVALSLFSMGKERLGSYSPLERERLQNSLIELLSFVLGTLLAAEMTAKQGTLFNYIIRAMLVIPDATIHTLIDILQPNGYTKYKEHIKKLSPTAQLFFETEFQKDKQFAETKSQVLRRLFGILENQTFERMFSHPTSKLDLFTEMNQGKVICINTGKNLLQQSGTEIFGRFFIALIAQAVQERAAIPENQRLPCFVYIDELSDYAANADQFLTSLFAQARKYKVGMCVAHQSLSDLSSKTADVLATNTSTKFVGGTSHSDTVKLSKELRVSTDFIEAQPKGTFAVFVRGATKTALSLSVPFGVMEKAPKMSDKEFEAVRDSMREKYAVKTQQPPQEEAVAASDEMGLTPTVPQEAAAAYQAKPTVVEQEIIPTKKKKRGKREVTVGVAVKITDNPDNPDTKPSSDW